MLQNYKFGSYWLCASLKYEIFLKAIKGMKANIAFDSNFAESLVAAGEREQGAMAARNREPVLAVAEQGPE